MLDENYKRLFASPLRSAARLPARHRLAAADLSIGRALRRVRPTNCARATATPVWHLRLGFCWCC